MTFKELNEIGLGLERNVKYKIYVQFTKKHTRELTHEEVVNADNDTFPLHVTNISFDTNIIYLVRKAGK